MFDDSFAVDALDERHSDGERRYVTIGRSDASAVLVVTYTLRSTRHGDQEIIRIISARRATRKERAAFALAEKNRSL